MKLARIEALQMKITRPMQSTPGVNAPGRRLDPALLRSVTPLLGLGLLLAFALLPEVARAQVQNSLTIQLSDHAFVRFNVDASVLARRFDRRLDDRAGRSFGGTYSIRRSTGERLGLSRFATVNERRERPHLRFHPSDRVRVRPRPNPTQPIPEPHAALLFAAGIGVIASATRRRR